MPPLQKFATCRTHAGEGNLDHLAMESPQLKRLQQFHEHFIERHSSPMRNKFLYEFGSEATGIAPTAKTKPISLVASPVPDKFAGQVFETTNQYRFRPYGEDMQIPAFRPEVKHRVMKAPTHDYTEAMFREWNVHGKPQK